MRLLLSLAALLFAASASADCMSQYTAYWPPPDATIGTQPTILINGMGGDQAIVKGMKGASLVAPGHTVTLRKTATNVGAFEVTQTVWTPAEALKPGGTYTLVVQGRSKTWRPTAYIAAAKKKLRHRYTVAKTPRPALAWTGAPILGKGSNVPFGCGPAINQSVELPTTHKEGLVQVTVTHGAQTRTFVLPLSKDRPLAVGHGMCSGPFAVGSEGEYTATFALINDGASDADAAKTVTFPGVTGG